MCIYLYFLKYLHYQRFLKAWITFIVQSYVLICTCIFFSEVTPFKDLLEKKKRLIRMCLFCLHICTPGACGGQKWVSDPLELKLPMDVSHHVGAVKQAQILSMSRKCSVNYTPLSIFSKNKKAFFIKIEKVHRNVSVKTWLLDLSLRILLHFFFFFLCNSSSPKFSF